MSDENGLATPGVNDLTGAVRGAVGVDPDYLLAEAQKVIKRDGKKTITSIRFDAARRAYVIEGHAKLFGRFRGPAFSVTLAGAPGGHLTVTGHSWADWILRLFRQSTVTDFVEKSVKDYQVPIRTAREGKKLVVEGIQNLTIPLGSEDIKLTISDYAPRAGTQGPFSIAPDGRIASRLEGTIKGHLFRASAAAARKSPDTADLYIRFVARSDKSVTTRVTGKATLAITEKQLVRLTGDRGKMLFPLLKSGQAHLSDLVIAASYSDLKRWDSTISGKARIETPQGLRIETAFKSVVDDAGKAVTGDAGPIDWRDKFNGRVQIAGLSLRNAADGISLDIQDGPDQPVTVPFADNKIGLLVGGDAYLRELLAGIRQAREGVLLETFGFPHGERPEALLGEILRKAGGLHGAAYSGTGIRAKLLVDPGPFGTENLAGAVLSAFEGTGKSAWADRFMADVRSGKGDFGRIPAAEREAFLARIRENVTVLEHPGGLARTNHRKVVLVDGVLGFTGGINVGDDHFSSVQDAMAPTIGPAVRNLAENFFKTWLEDGGTFDAQDQAAFIKDDSAIAAQGMSRFGHLVAADSAPSRILVTGDRQGEIHSAYLEAIGQARRSIKLEQQYLTERRIVSALEDAVRAGRAVTVVIPEDTGNEFELGNNLAILRLLEASSKPGGGTVDLRYYQTRGQWKFHVHSKIIEVDGERAMVGSANVDQRAMRGLAATPAGKIPWNMELNLDVADPGFAERVDRDVFQVDTQRANSRDVWEKVAATRLAGSLYPRDKAISRFHAGKPALKVLETMAADLHAARGREVAAALLAAGDSPAEKAAIDALKKRDASAKLQWETTWVATATMSAELRQAAQRYGSDPAGSTRTIRALAAQMASRIAEALPAGRGRDVETHLANASIEHLLAQLEKHPQDPAVWFVDHITGQWALATSHIALYELEGAMGDLLPRRRFHPPRWDRQRRPAARRAQGAALGRVQRALLARHVLNLVSTRLLGVVQGQVGRLQEDVRIVAVFGRRGHPEAGRDFQPSRVRREVAHGNAVANAFGDHQTLVAVGLRQDERELVSAIAADDVVNPRAELQN
ncbi:MAG: phosphatidylserine/phosphatidylglycerophosphate/cardiolipin synthase family protein [Candidatus Sericytochromatia bacterium]|uniref:Phosphatidylserine/phosphatidylglycerophosphate/ cardiolipin synthase family protein n=1 Tax=Candidatus Tanganyikabacteria bacterium TaxID=2961651 RepID=A0A937X128_9BACT|nr:phosphatidylserine/phosphatidylglycerophosphate/cardiolipin synthase family protein [Candidatus Tanganyikabacteria bacterium]